MRLAGGAGSGYTGGEAVRHPPPVMDLPASPAAAAVRSSSHRTEPGAGFNVSVHVPPLIPQGAAERRTRGGTLNQFHSFSSSQAAITNSLPPVSRSLTATLLQNALESSRDVARVNPAVVSLVLHPPPPLIFNVLGAAVDLLPVRL